MGIQYNGSKLKGRSAMKEDFENGNSNALVVLTKYSKVSLWFSYKSYVIFCSLLWWLFMKLYSTMEVDAIGLPVKLNIFENFGRSEIFTRLSTLIMKAENVGTWILKESGNMVFFMGYFRKVNFHFHKLISSWAHTAIIIILNSLKNAKNISQSWW